VQFKGSVRAPGDKDPGVRVVLEIDEYHLEIRRDSELIGRYYLADVEVARDIAERFILFLGEDEVEFLADDALQFAYGGVTAMQDGWLSAQKRKRRHRRAAEEAARRKDGERPMETEVPVARPVYVSDSDTIRNRRRQVAGKSPEPAAPERTFTAESPAIPQPPPGKGAHRTARKAVAAAKASPPLDAEETVASPMEEMPAAPVAVVGSGPETPEPRASAEPAAATRRRPKGAKGPVPIAAGQGDSSLREDSATVEASRTGAAAETAPAEAEPEAAPDLSLAARRRKITADAKPKGPDDLGRVRVPEPVSGTAVRESRSAASAPPVEPTQTNVQVEADEVRFAQEGHHPAETSTGLLAKLRRQPKLPTNHVHKFKEAGSSVGLVRRVCIECAYVSIGSDDN
jgi:hypothetical protein